MQSEQPPTDKSLPAAEPREGASLTPPPLPAGFPEDRITADGPLGFGDVPPPAQLVESEIRDGFYLLVQGRRVGPLPKADLLRYGLDHHTLVWTPGAARWLPAREMPELDDVLHWVPPPAPGVFVPGDLNYAVPTPRSFQVFSWWVFAVGISSLLFWLLMIAFIIIYDNDRTFIHHGHWMEMRRNNLWFTLAVASAVVAGFLFICCVILYTVLLHKMWCVIQDGYTKMSAGMAVGLLFVPVFNLFWVFMAIFGWSREANAYLLRHGVNARPAPTGLALATCICLILPWVNLLALYTLGIVTLIILKNTAMDIAAYRLRDD